MEFPYLIKSHKHLTQYLACNLLPKGYHFYSLFAIPPEKDPVLIDAKLMCKYDCYMSKSKAYRRRKAGFATVRYFRVGRLALLISTKGTSAFFEQESWSDARDNPICVGGYSISVSRDRDKVSVRLHRETQRRLKRFLMTWSCRRDLDWWKRWVKKFPYLPFNGVRTNLFALLRLLNANRKSFRLAQLDLKDRNLIRKTFTPDQVFLDTPLEVAELLHFESRRR